MMEGLNQLGQEEYIWAMRTGGYQEPDIDDLSALSTMHKKSKADIESSDEYQTRVMASLVPDEVINNVDDYSHRDYDACFLFGDVSGFTDLCEKYTKTGASGPSRMTQVLNTYLGSMVQEVMSHNGDVLKFSGDAFLAMFKASESETMRDAIHEALDCALVIQKDYGSYLTDVGIKIRVKLAISAGLVTFALIGYVSASHYVVVGKPIWDVKAAESISSAGDIVVAPAAWHYLNANEYDYMAMSDNIHIKILGVGPNWRSVQKNVRQLQEETEELSADEESSESSVLSEISAEVVEDFSLRPAVNLAVRLNTKESLRRFIIAPVMKSIDQDEPFEYLTEMRQAVIVFINVVSSSLRTNETVILADRTYKIVCRVVHKMKGCVNKVSLFDKDLMFVVIFGLRGLKHELECQIALRCARECHTAIAGLPGVLSASIGVTTGKTYCGVFGHTLRREYTVISLIVNKAARLMVAYKGQVTCDRETFLHSKLETKHFILQEYKYLKGISHPGPVYEFREAEIDHEQIQKINASPLLGRSEKLALYNDLLNQCRSASTEDAQIYYKMLAVKGDARQGKTRLLDEFIYITPAGIPIYKITLTRKDQKIPYLTTRLIFNNPLSLTLESSAKDKEEKLSMKLKSSKSPDLICVLNDVFAVSFNKTEAYLSLTEPERKQALRKIIKQLAHACFTTLWVIAIDDCQCVDDLSWDLLRVLFEEKNLFLVITIGRDAPDKSIVVKEILKDPRVRTTHLNAIKRCYLGALACQILDVYAISPELEKAIQTKSNGNAGWVENFLITLLQDEALYMLQVNLSEINELGLICPPLYMMARLTTDETRKWQNVMEEVRPAGKDSQKYIYDHWQQYIDCCRDSFLDVTGREKMEGIPKGGKLPICVISPNFNVADDEMELSMDTMILKAFDSLNFFEQLLVKCSATLGNQFFRDMLLYVMSAKDKRAAALAVQKLFEIRVLTCAKGDFLEGEGTVFKEKLLNPTEETELKCQCRGIKIDVECVDLPKYASCGYMQFRSSQFREITYSLLTFNQKKDFHSSSIRYLEREARKCKACGGGFFDKLLGYRQDKELIAERDKVKGTEASGTRWEVRSVSTDLPSEVSSVSGFSGSGVGSVRGSRTGSIASVMRKLSRKSISSVASQIMGEAKEEKPYKALFGFVLIKKLKHSYSLTKEFSSEDFSDCRCNFILSTTYAQLIDHSMGAGDLDKALEAMLKYAHVCIILHNIPLALRSLSEALNVLQKMSLKKMDNPWKLTLIRAKIYILVGYSKLELGHLEDAHDSLNSALAEYGITFPTGAPRRMRNCAYEFRRFFGLYIFPNTLIGHLSHWQTIYANDLSECLSHLCTLFMVQNDWKAAEMAASWSFTRSLKSFSDFRLICTACTNMIRVAQHFARWNLCMALEVYGLKLCHLKKQAVQAEDLRSIAQLYAAIFASRIHRADVEKAIHIGYIILRISSSIRAYRIILPMLPNLLEILLTGRHFNNALSILQEIKLFSEEDTDRSGIVWYFALGMCLQLETGYSIVSYDDCENFYQFEGERWVSNRDPDARIRFLTVMWLWCIRQEKWEAAAVWSIKTQEYIEISDKNSLSHQMSALYFLEGLLILLVTKLDRQNIVAIIHTEQEIKQLVKYIEKAAETMKLILPRVHHLKAYYSYIKNNEKYLDQLDKANYYAQKYGNALAENWIAHTRKAWKKQLSAADTNFWKEHTESDLLDFREIEGAGEPIGFFTLPTPMYF